MSQKIFFTNNVGKTLEQLHDKLAPSKTMILTDNNIDEQYVTPILSPVLVGGPLEDIDIMSINPGEEHKNIDEVKNVWKFFEEYGMTRSSLLINIGGGVITDMGGFAASCFKRGIRFINVPTTILGAVDAAVGGKTGVDFNGFKNEIGVFNEAEAVIISSWVFESLPHQERLSGFAEMMKHAMLSSAEDFDEILKIRIIRNLRIVQRRLLPLKSLDPFVTEVFRVFQSSFCIHLILLLQEIGHHFGREILALDSAEQVGCRLVETDQLGEIDIGRAFTGNDKLATDTPQDETFLNFHIR